MMKTFKKLITCSVISGTILFSASVWSSVDSSWIFRISYIIFLWCNIRGRETIDFNVYIVISLRILFVIPWLIRKKPSIYIHIRSLHSRSFFVFLDFNLTAIFLWSPLSLSYFHAGANVFQLLTSVSKMAP